MKNTFFHSLTHSLALAVCFFLIIGCNKEDVVPLSEEEQLSPLMTITDDGPLKDGGVVSNFCDCELQILEAYSPVPEGGEGGVLGYDLRGGPFVSGCYSYGAFATDCAIGIFPGTDPNCDYQVPAGNNPVYPTGFFPFNNLVPSFEDIGIQPGSVAWFDAGGCVINQSSNDDGYLVVRFRCCDDGESECRQCYYSDPIQVTINTQFAGGPLVPASLGGLCGCEPMAG